LTAAYFYGNAPNLSTEVFLSCASGFTVYYLASSTGFSNPWYGYPTAVFDPNATTTTTTAGNTNPCTAQKVLGENNPELDNLRDFRDSSLAQSAVGRRVIQIYYTNADSINEALEHSPALQTVTRRVLEMIAPVVGRKEE